MLDRRTFLIKQRVGFLKLVDTFDIYDAATGVRIGLAREEISPLLKLARVLFNKRLLPTRVEVREHDDGASVLSIRRGFTFLQSQVTVRDRAGKELGHFKSKEFSIGGGFHVFDASNKHVAEITGDWEGWNFQFVTQDGKHLGKVTKTWTGLGQEFFTSADNYVIAIDEDPAVPPQAAALLLAAGLAIDIVYRD